MKFVIAVMYLSCLIVEGLGMGHNCGLPVPNNCQNNPRIGLSKSNTHYRLSLCSEGQCLPSEFQRWIECSDICEICRSLPGAASCTSDAMCEQRVDSYLNSYCESALLSTVTQSGPTTTVTSTQAPVTVTRVETTTTTSISMITITPTNSGSSSLSTSSSSLSGEGTGDATQNSPSTITAQQKSEFALAALLGLSMIILMAMIIGWVLTCLVMKKKARENSKSSSQMSFSASFDNKKYFKNPVYESNEISPSPSAQTELVESLTPEQQKFQKVKYDRILAVPPSQIENGRKYDVLNRQPTFRGTDPSVASRTPQCVQNGNNVDGQISTPPSQYSYSQLDHKNTNLENHYCATTLAE